MSLFSFFFQVGPAVKLMMQEGRRITSDDFKELTPEQYKAFHKQGNKNKGRVLALYHKLEDGTTDTGMPIMICEEQELPIFDNAWEYIENMSEKSSRPHDTEVEKLSCVARNLPDVFIEGGPFDYVIEERNKKSQG